MTSDQVVEGPITGMPFLMNTTSKQTLSDAGYEALEFFISGLATSYRNVKGFPSDGKWEVEPAKSAAYKTRFLVYRPVDAYRFNGTVVVEWFNVTGGLEAGPEWILMHTEFIRRGYIWVGVSTQCGGVEGNTKVSFNIVNMYLKNSNAKRYSSLCHPGDAYCYDIFSQIAKAIRNPGSTNPLAGYHVERVLAIGESQSAMYLTSYINAIQPRDRLFDGFLLHGRAGTALFDCVSAEDKRMSALCAETLNFFDFPPVYIRTDINVPVLMLQSETDLFVLDYFKARQNDSDKIRLWEMAGTAHADIYMFRGVNDKGDNVSIANVVEVKPPFPGVSGNVLPANSGPQHFIAKAAIHQLDKWVRTGTPPTVAARLEVAGNPPCFVLDQFGNAKGGIRTSYVDAPIATLSGLNPAADSIVLSLFGFTRLFDRATLQQLYPNHQAYVAAVEKATDSAVLAGFLLPEDGQLIKAAAAASDIGNPQPLQPTNVSFGQKR
jgi:hypothetical protein